MDRSRVTLRPKEMFGSAPFVMQCRGQRVYGISADELPRTWEALSAKKFAQTELVMRIVSWFECARLLSRAEAVAFADSTISIIDSIR